MNTQTLEPQSFRSYEILKTKGYDFIAKYLAVCDVHSIARNNPRAISSDMICALESVFQDLAVSQQTQCLILYKEAADALRSIVVRTLGGPLAHEAISTLENVLGSAAGHGHRAAAEALGSPPVSIRGPEINEETPGEVPRVRWQEVLENKGISVCAPPKLLGRSLVVPIEGEATLLVVKLARAEASAESMHREAVWMKHLSSGGYSFPVRFNIPAAMSIEGSYVFRLQDIPVRQFDGTDVHPRKYAVGFLVHQDYFTYPNEHGMHERLSMEQFREVMFRNAWLLGKLASLGIIHSAPIPLFHNRVQTNRRADNGVYEWWRGGRLDRWLYSCRYPNFGLTGIRDFEHFISFKGPSLALYRHIGSHILSLFLVAASYFRNKDTQRVGLGVQGVPVDARDLFDKTLFREVIQGIFLSCYHGFVGKQFTGHAPIDFDELASLMIEEMGIDRHMEEVFRVVDQEQLTADDFADFLKKRGFADKEIAAHKKGVEDIIIHTGPHLGGFNERISLPELIEALGTLSALCMVGRFWEQNLFHAAALP